MSFSGWVGFDLDGTLAIYEGWKGIDHIGAPIKPTCDLVRKYLAEGVEVRIFTARAQTPEAIPVINDWVKAQFGVELKITNIKDFAMIRLYDDRAVAVEFNTGRLAGFEGYDK